MSFSDYIFREAGERDFNSIEEFFDRYGYSPKPVRGWTVWKYLNNPDGRARVFVAEDRAKMIVGTLAYLPRRFTSGKTGTLDVMQVVDMFVSPELRKEGVFLRLLHFSGRHMDVPKIGVPNDSSKVFGSTAGWRVLGPHETWRFPVLPGVLLTGRKLGFIAPLANALSRIYEIVWLPGSLRGLEMTPVTRFKTDYALDPGVIHGHGQPIFGECPRSLEIRVLTVDEQVFAFIILF